MGKKLTLKEIRDVSREKARMICLATEYKNVDTPMPFVCLDCGKYSMKRFGSIKYRNGGCKYCRCKKTADAKRKSIKYLNDFARREHNGRCLSTEYNTINDKYEWLCEFGHKWRTTGNHVVNGGHWCPICSGQMSYSLEDLQKHAVKNNGECRSIEYINSNTTYHWYCNEHKLNFYNRWNSVKNRGQWCPLCGNEKRIEKNRKYTIKDLKEFAIKKNGKCNSKTYTSMKDSYEWYCNEHNYYWKNSWGNVLYAGHWCTRCNQSKMEKYCRETIEYLTQKKFPSIYPKWLKNPKTGHSLELDGYNKELKIAFEYQGGQHYEKDHYFHRTGNTTFKQRQELDKLKRKICKQKGILLLEPNYKMSEKEILRYFYVNISKFFRGKHIN